MALNNYQFQFGSYVFGGGDSPHQILSVDGLESLPDIRTQDDNRGYNDGMFTGRDFLSGRNLTMEILTLAGNGYSAFQNFQFLQNALIPQANGTTSLQFLMSQYDTEMVVGARVRSRRATVDPEYTFGYIRAQYMFFCPDPRYYTNTLTTTSLIPTTVLGRTYNRTYNLTYGGGSAGAVINNVGNTTTYPVITITGPVTSPTIANNSTEQYITVNTTLGALDTLVIDLYEKTITLNGSPARNLLAGNSQWFGAAPGDTLFQFTGSSYTGATSATVTYRSAFI